MRSDKGFGDESFGEIRNHLVKNWGGLDELGEPRVFYKQGSANHPQAQQAVESVHKPLRRVTDTKREPDGTLTVKGLSESETLIRRQERNSGFCAYDLIDVGHGVWPVGVGTQLKPVMGEVEYLDQADTLETKQCRSNEIRYLRQTRRAETGHRSLVAKARTTGARVLHWQVDDVVSVNGDDMYYIYKLNERQAWLKNVYGEKETSFTQPLSQDMLIPMNHSVSSYMRNDIDFLQLGAGQGTGTLTEINKFFVRNQATCKWNTGPN